jgi:hypothetical protein
VLAVPAARQLQRVVGHWLAFSHRPAPAGGALVLTVADARLEGLALHMQVSRVKGIAAELTLAPPPGVQFALPEDPLALPGLPWSRLSRNRAAGEWRASIVLRGDGHERGADAERKFVRSVEHLAHTLAGTPAQFHQPFLRRRWGVALRRATPLAVTLGLVAAAPSVPLLDLGSDSVLRMLIFNSPLLLVWLFSMYGMPRLEIPPLPRRPALPGWQAPAPTPATASS